MEGKVGEEKEKERKRERGREGGERGRKGGRFLERGGGRPPKLPRCWALLCVPFLLVAGKPIAAGQQTEVTSQGRSRRSKMTRPKYL